MRLPTIYYADPDTARYQLIEQAFGPAAAAQCRQLVVYRENCLALKDEAEANRAAAKILLLEDSARAKMIADTTLIRNKRIEQRANLLGTTLPGVVLGGGVVGVVVKEMQPSSPSSPNLTFMNTAEISGASIVIALILHLLGNRLLSRLRT